MTKLQTRRQEIVQRLTEHVLVEGLNAASLRPLAKAFLKAFVGDTAAYFFAPGMKARMRGRLEAELPPDGD